MVDEIKKKYMKNTGEKESIINVADMLNRLYNTEKASIDAGIDSIKQEYEEKMNKLKKAKEDTFKTYENLGTQLFELSRFKLVEIGPVMAEIITLYEGKEYEYRTNIEYVHSYREFYNFGIMAQEESIRKIQYSEMLLYRTRYIPNNTMQFFGCVKETNERIEITKHKIFDRCPYLFEFVEMLISASVATLPQDEQLAAIKKVEAEFIRKNIDKIKQRYNEITIQEQAEYQIKLEQDSANRKELLSKTLEKINTESEPLK